MPFLCLAPELRCKACRAGEAVAPISYATACCIERARRNLFRLLDEALRHSRESLPEQRSYRSESGEPVRLRPVVRSAIAAWRTVPQSSMGLAHWREVAEQVATSWIFFRMALRCTLTVASAMLSCLAIFLF